jgi:5-(carboxyamino)imidazole ribonucleotide synthase
MLPSPKKIGIIGGGQLGKMLAEAASPWISTLNFLDLSGAPCESKAHQFIAGSLYDPQAILSLASISDVITYEIEHLHVDTLLALEKEGKEIIPSPRVLAIIKDKAIQNQFFTQHSIPTPPYFILQEESDWTHALDAFEGDKIVVKSRQGGYDGKGVQIVSKHEIHQGLRPFPTDNTLFESFLTEVTEVSVIVAIDTFGNKKTYPPVCMEFDPKSNLVLFLHTETGLEKNILKECERISLRTAEAFSSPGLFAVELFVSNKTGEVFVNEVAPRPHNSGHHSIEACYTSQYEQLIRIVSGLPLGSTDLIKPAAMLNLVGPTDFSGAYELTNLETSLQIPGIYVHLYGKKESRPNRKLGHITVIAGNKETLMEKVEIAKTIQVSAI